MMFLLRIVGAAVIVFLAGCLFALGCSVALDIREWLADRLYQPFRPPLMERLREWWARQTAPLPKHRKFYTKPTQAEEFKPAVEAAKASSRRPSVRRLGETLGRPEVWIGDPGEKVRD